MKKIIKIVDFLGTELRSRSSADRLREMIIKEHYSIIDMSGISFISRSFADELCNIMDTYNNVSVSNDIDIVKNMIEIVSQSRKHKRVRVEDNSEIKEFDDIESLSKFLSTI